VSVHIPTLPQVSIVNTLCLFELQVPLPISNIELVNQTLYTHKTTHQVEFALTKSPIAVLDSALVKANLHIATELRQIEFALFPIAILAVPHQLLPFALTHIDTPYCALFFAHTPMAIDCLYALEVDVAPAQSTML
jgi:hypothetical protein